MQISQRVEKYTKSDIFVSQNLFNDRDIAPCHDYICTMASFQQTINIAFTFNRKSAT
jgi:hypothetical protein